MADPVPASTWLTYETINRSQHEADWRQLYAFFRQDFKGAMAGELERIFEEDADRLARQLRHLALVPWYCTTKARPYTKPPLRDVTAGSQAQASKMLDIYRASKYDAGLLAATQLAWSCNSVVLSFDAPTSPTKMRMRRHIPADVLVHGDPTIDDIREADAVEIRWPVSYRATTSTVFVHYGRAVYTPNEAYIESSDGGERVGIYNDDGSHPLGYVPLVAGRLTEAEDGLFFPAPPGDVLSLQIGMIIAAADMEAIARQKVSPRELLIGGPAKTEAQEISASPYGINGIPGTDIKYEVASMDPRIDRYIEAIQWTFNNWAMLRDLNKDGLWASTAITGAGKEVERAAMLEDLARQEQLWREMEQDMAEVVADVSKLGPSALSISDPRVRVDYRYFQPRENTLQEAQALALNSAIGAERVSHFLAHRRNIPLEQAQEEMLTNLQEHRETLERWRPPPDIQAPPGLDEIAQQVMRPQGGGQ